MKNICVFCGSGPGNEKAYVDAAKTIGRTLAENDFGLVYGGGKLGLMGTAADSCLENKGNVYGVIPEMMVEKERAHPGLTELHIVDSMHERKALMNKLSIGFAVLPGGIGTLDEMCEIMTWNQLEIIDKPICILNTLNYFDPFINMLESFVSGGFFKQEQLNRLEVFRNEKELITFFKS